MEATRIVPYSELGFALKFLGTGGPDSTSSSCAFYLADEQSVLLVLGYTPGMAEKIAPMITINTKKVIFYTNFVSARQFEDFEVLGAIIQKEFPEVELELYLNMMANIESFYGAKPSLLRLIYSALKFRIVITGYDDWRELCDDVNCLNLASPNGPRIFLAEEF